MERKRATATAPATRRSVLANVEGAVIRVDKDGEDVPEATHAALRALESGLEHHHQRRRHDTKAAGARLQGSIKRIFRHAGYGFIHYLPGQDVYFRRGALHGLDFDTLAPGHPVEFETEPGERGLQSPRVSPVGDRGRV